MLNNLSLDFCDETGRAVDTIIFAGENGCGKSTIINELYKVASHTVSCECEVEFENVDNRFNITYYHNKMGNGKSLVFADDHRGMNVFIQNQDIKNRYSFSGVFSDVDINFRANNVSSVTSLSLDDNGASRRSTNDLPTHIKQLIIDIQALDDADVAYAVRTNPNISLSEMIIAERMPRFTRAFNKMFENLTYSHVENVQNTKAIFFDKYGKRVKIDDLSSGEKQVVYRGCFLLKDINAIDGFVLTHNSSEDGWYIIPNDEYRSIGRRT